MVTASLLQLLIATLQTPLRIYELKPNDDVVYTSLNPTSLTVVILEQNGVEEAFAYNVHKDQNITEFIIAPTKFIEYVWERTQTS